jgi:hypothetical protein
MSDHLPQRRMQRPATPCNQILAPTHAIERFLRSRNELSQRQRNAVELLLQGLSDQEAAAQVGVDRSTIFRWRKSIAFARELDRQRRLRCERAANQLQSMVPSALSILRQQLESDDPKQRIRAATILLRVATPGRLAPTAPTNPTAAPSAASPAAPPPARHGAEAAARAQEKREIDDLIAYVEAPLPGEPGAPEDLDDLDEDANDDLGDEEDFDDEDDDDDAEVADDEER